MTDNMVNTEADATGAPAEGQNNKSQVEGGKMFSQEEVNDIITRRLAQVNKKFAEVDPNEYAELKRFKESIEEEQLMKRQDFETLLKKTKEKSDTEVNTLRTELTKIKVDGALINAASKAKAVAPDQVAKLLKDYVRLETNGSVTVLDDSGQPRYNDNAEPMSVDALTEEFLSKNSFFRSAGPSGTGSASNTGEVTQQKLDLASLDMTRADHRELYRKWKATGKL